MKILIITTNGITQAFKSWPERLQARGLAQRGHAVRAITYLGQKDFNRQEREVIDGVEVRRLRRHDWLSVGLARELLFGPRPDVVHLHHLSNQFAFETAVICKLRRIPLVMTPHGLFHDPYLVADRDRPFATPARYADMILTPGQLFAALRRKFKPKRQIKNFLNHSPLRMMDRVIGLSQHGRAVLLKLGIEDKHIAVVPNAIDQDWADEIEPLPSELNGLEGPLVLYLGQLKYRKGFDLLAQAIPAILESCPEAHFVFAGHSPIHEAELLRLVDQAGARDRLTLLHNVSEGQKAALFRRAAQSGVYVLPTRYEGFGIPLIEAMSVGCPVVSTDIPVIDELIIDGENGLLFPLEDVKGLAEVVIRVLQDADLRARIADGGCQTVTRYFTPAILDQLETIYRDVQRMK
jgi:glycogen synthase